jgi:hypothetical protein
VKIARFERRNVLWSCLQNLQRAWLLSPRYRGLFFNVLCHAIYAYLARIRSVFVSKKIFHSETFPWNRLPEIKAISLGTNKYRDIYRILLYYATLLCYAICPMIALLILITTNPKHRSKSCDISCFWLFGKEIFEGTRRKRRIEIQRICRTCKWRDCAGYTSIYIHIYIYIYIYIYTHIYHVYIYTYISQF